MQEVLAALEVVQDEIAAEIEVTTPEKRPELESKEEITLDVGQELLDHDVPEVINSKQLALEMLQTAVERLEETAPSKQGAVAKATQQVIQGARAVIQDIRENPGEYAKDFTVGMIPYGEQALKLVQGEEITRTEVVIETAITIFPVGRIGKIAKKSLDRVAKTFMKAVEKEAKVATKLRTCLKDLEKKSGLPTIEKQRTLLADALRGKKFKKLGDVEKIEQESVFGKTLMSEATTETLGMLAKQGERVFRR